MQVFAQIFNCKVEEMLLVFLLAEVGSIVSIIDGFDPIKEFWEFSAHILSSKFYFYTSTNIDSKLNSDKIFESR